MPLILKNYDGHRRASFISQEDAARMVGAGRAKQFPGYDIYEEIEAEYATKEMTPRPKRSKAAAPADTDASA